MKKGDYVFIKPHDCREDVICGNKFPRRLGGEIYKFVHFTNSDTAFVSRPVSYCDCVEDWERTPKDEDEVEVEPDYYDGNDRILVPKDAIVFLMARSA